MDIFAKAPKELVKKLICLNIFITSLENIITLDNKKDYW